MIIFKSNYYMKEKGFPPMLVFIIEYKFDFAINNLGK